MSRIENYVNNCKKDNLVRLTTKQINEQGKTAESPRTGKLSHSYIPCIRVPNLAKFDHHEP